MLGGMLGMVASVGISGWEGAVVLSVSLASGGSDGTTGVTVGSEGRGADSLEGIGEVLSVGSGVLSVSLVSGGSDGATGVTVGSEGRGVDSSEGIGEVLSVGSGEMSSLGCVGASGMVRRASSTAGATLSRPWPQVSEVQTQGVLRVCPGVQTGRGSGSMG